MWFRWVNLVIGIVAVIIALLCLVLGSPALAVMDFAIAGFNFYMFYSQNESVKYAARLNRKAGECFRTGSWAVEDKAKDGLGRDEVT